MKGLNSPTMGTEQIGGLGVLLFLIGLILTVGAMIYALTIGLPPIGSTAGWVWLAIGSFGILIGYVGVVLANYARTGNLGRVVLETVIGFAIVMAVIVVRILLSR